MWFVGKLGRDSLGEHSDCTTEWDFLLTRPDPTQVASCGAKTTARCRYGSMLGLGRANVGLVEMSGANRSPVKFSYRPG